MSRRRTGLAACFAGLTLTAVVSCSLGLDESLIGGGPDGGGGPVDGSPGDGEPKDAGVPETGFPVGPDASICTNDADCATNAGCLKGKCDLSRKSCVYDVCRPSECMSSECAEATRTCAPPAPYKLKAAQFPLGAQLSCAKCLAAVYPWLYAVTATGVVAIDVSNPANASPPLVPVVGLGFVPQALVQSGSRVWMLGEISGNGPSRAQVAYIDSPADPFTKTITAHTVLATYNRPAESTALFARGGDSALLVGKVAQFPAAAVEAPLVEPVSITATPVLAPQGLSPSAVSGTRLLTGGVSSAKASFALIENAGSAQPAPGPTVAFNDAGSVSTQSVFAQSADGAIFWATGALQVAPAPNSTRAARGYFLVPGEVGAIEENAGVDIEVYSLGAVGPGAAIFGTSQAGAAMLDAKTVMIATQARENDQQTAVQFVQREPLGVVKDGAVPRRVVLPIPVNLVVATAASNGVGYLVANDQAGPPPASTVYVFDPACAP